MFSDTISSLLEASNPELDAYIRDLELQRRAIDSHLAAAIAAADTHCLYADDGHRSLAAYLRATCNWSHGEVARFTGASKLVNAYPSIGDAWADGHIGSSQVAVLSTTHANKRVAHRFEEFVPILLDNAAELPHRHFTATVDRFVMLADTNGTHDDKAAIEARTAQAVDVAGELNVRAAGGSRLHTAEFLAIFDRFVEHEFQSDLEQRRELEAVAGPGVAFPEARALTQRRFDALLAMARAANAHLDGNGTFDPAEPLVSILVDQHTWSWALAHSGLGATTSLAGESIDPFTGLPADNMLLADLLGDPAGLTDRRCETSNGIALRPDDVLRAALAGKMRRVVLGAKSRPIDLGRSERVFTGAARDAAKLLVAWCEHPGCDLPAELCQVDHSDEWYELGRTDQDNSGIRCPGHNREKHRTKRRIKRGTNGRNYTLRPDGTIILPVGCRQPEFDDDDDIDPARGRLDRSGQPGDVNSSGDPARTIGTSIGWGNDTPEDERRLVETARNRLVIATAG